MQYAQLLDSQLCVVLDGMKHYVLASHAGNSGFDFWLRTRGVFPVMRLLILFKGRPHKVRLAAKFALEPGRLHLTIK